MRADRLLSLLLHLQSKPRHTAQELAKQLEVSERTIYRDIEALNIAGIPVYTQTGMSGGIFMDENYRLALSGLTPDEIRSLFIPSGSGPLDDLGLARAASATLLKLRAALPARQRDEAERLRQRIYIDPVGWFQSAEPTPYLPLLQQAVWEDRRINATYERANGAASHRLVEPYALVAKSNVWYLLGKQAEGDWRTFRISRFHAVTLTEERFARPTDFDLAAYWQDTAQAFEQQMLEGQTPCQVTVRVHPRSVWYFANSLSGRYDRIAEPDPTGWTRLRLTYPSLAAAHTGVLALGADVEVLGPRELREQVAVSARALVGLYQ